MDSSYVVRSFIQSVLNLFWIPSIIDFTIKIRLIYDIAIEEMLSGDKDSVVDVNVIADISEQWRAMKN